MALKINALNLRDNLAQDMNRNTLGLAKQMYSLPAFVPQFKNGRDAMMPKGAIMPSGEVTGQGTPTSDSIQAQISNEEAILNAGAVMALKQLLGEDVIERLNQQHAPEGAETTVKSGVLHAAAGYDDPYNPSRAEPFNQRPANTVSGLKERLPAAGQNAAAQAANFRQAAPTITPEAPQGLKARMAGAERGALGEVMGAKRASQFVNPLPTDARPTIAQQAPSGPNLAVNERGIPLDRPASGGIGFKSGLKNLMSNLGGAGALSTGLASDVLNSPAIANQTNQAIEAYKQRSGFTGTPYAALKDANLPQLSLPQVQQVAPSLAKGAIETRTPIADTASSPAQTAPVQTQQPPSLNQTVTPTLRTAQGAINPSASYNTTGLRNDHSVQVLDWNESRFDNSGDPVQDAALQARRGANAGLRGQGDVLSQYDPEIARSLDPRSAVLPEEIAQRAQENTSNVGLGYAKIAADKDIAGAATAQRQAQYQQENQGFDEADNAAIEAALKGNPAGRAYIQSRFGKNKIEMLAKLYPDIFATTE